MVAHDSNVSTEGPRHEYVCELDIFWSYIVGSEPAWDT